MDTSRYGKVVKEIECGNNFGYVLKENAYFANTDYKVLQSQKNGIFLKVMKILYNGSIKLYYITEDYRPMSSMFYEMNADKLLTIILNLFANIIEVKKNGFLSSQNIVVSWDKIFVDPNTLKVKLVYLPVNMKVFKDYEDFESELRANLIKLINKILISSNDRMEQFVLDLSNGTIRLSDLYNKTCIAGEQIEYFTMSREDSKTNSRTIGNITIEGMRLVAINAPSFFEIVINNDDVVLGKKAEIVDIAIPFSRMISRKHCRIVRRNGGYYITDEGSANGTYVNKVRVAQNQLYPIHSGDIIRLANIDFQII